MQKKCIVLFAYIFIGFGCVAQFVEHKGQYPFVHYTPKDGLVNSRVRNAYQDSKGRMYFLTYGGLSVFDGTRFRNYTRQDGLITDLVNDVLEVGEDSLLIATNNFGLNALVRGQIKRLQFSNNIYPIVNHFLKSDDGTIYATADEGLYVLRSTGFEKLNTWVESQNESAIYLGLVAEYKDWLIFTTNDLRKYTRLYLYNKKKNQVTDLMPNLYVTCIKKDPKGAIWVSTGTDVVNLDTNSLKTDKLSLVKSIVNGAEISLPAALIFFSRHDELLISYGNKQLIRYHNDGTQQVIFWPELSISYLINFFIDRENLIWVCHDGQGVYKLTGASFQPFGFSGTGNSTINQVNRNTKDSIWMILDSRKLMLLSNEKTKQFSVSPIFPISSVHSNGADLYVNHLNKLYFSSAQSQGQQVLHFRQVAELPGTHHFTRRSIIDPERNIIFFSYNNILVLQKEKIIYRRIINDNDLVEGVAIDNQDNLWVVSRGKGLQKFTIHPGTSEYLHEIVTYKKEMGTNTARCMVIDENEIIWVGTRYDGLLGFIYKDNKLEKRYHFQTQQGLTDNFVTDLAIDRDNNIIVGTQTGMDRLIPDKTGGYRFENVSKTNNSFAYIGQVWTDKFRNAYALTNSGNVFKVEPVQSQKTDFEPQLLIGEIKVNGKDYSNLSIPMRLKHDENNISFSVAAPTFIDEKQVKFSYLLSEKNSGVWSDTTSIADINLLNLSPGNYSLHIKAFFPSTTYKPKEISVPFSIRSPWWQTSLVRIAAILVFAAIGYFIVRAYFLRMLERKKMQFEKQQALEKERTRIAIDMHDDLGAGLSKIRFLSETVQRNIHEPEQLPNLQNISRSSVELVDKFNEIIWAMNEKNNSLEDLLYYIRSYTAKYCEENNLVYNIIIPEQIPSLIISGEIRRHIFLTVKESLHNVVKHAGAKNIWVSVHLDGMLSIEIRDDGKGFELSELKTTGNGLRNMEQRMKTIHGNLVIENKKGTLLKIELPLSTPGQDI